MPYRPGYDQNYGYGNGTYPNQIGQPHQQYQQQYGQHPPQQQQPQHVQQQIYAQSNLPAVQQYGQVYPHSQDQYRYQAPGPPAYPPALNYHGSPQANSAYQTAQASMPTYGYASPQLYQQSVQRSFQPEPPSSPDPLQLPNAPQEFIRQPAPAIANNVQRRVSDQQSRVQRSPSLAYANQPFESNPMYDMARAGSVQNRPQQPSSVQASQSMRQQNAPAQRIEVPANDKPKSRPQATHQSQKFSSMMPGLVVQQPQPKTPAAPVQQTRQQHIPDPPKVLSLQELIQQRTQNHEPTLSMPTSTIDPRNLGTRTVNVSIPVQRTNAQTAEYRMQPEPKRRRSDEGLVIPVSSSQKLSKPSDHRLPASSPLTDLTSSQIPPSPVIKVDVDHQSALLALSDEYVHAAYSMSAAIATSQMTEDQLEDYHGLLTTGMGCLDALLKHHRIREPRREARVRLRLATLLHEETENSEAAEEVLSKGIVVCERARLFESKYAMHHLLARIWFEAGKIKAAIKALEKLIDEAEKLSLVHWVYAFRLLRVSFGLQGENAHGETSPLIRQLVSIGETAQKYRHTAIQIVAATLEALVHLRSRSLEKLDNVDRALAAARRNQASKAMEDMPQIMTLIDCIDLAAHLSKADTRQAMDKMTRMRETMESSDLRTKWSKDGAWLTALSGIKPSSEGVEHETGGLIKTSKDGCLALELSWLDRIHADSLGYLLGGVASMHADTGHENKAGKWLGEGIKNCNIKPKPAPLSLTTTITTSDSLKAMQVVLRLYAAAAYCRLAQWDEATKGLLRVRKDIRDSDMPADSHCSIFCTYLEGVCKQALGDLPGATKLYTSPSLTIDWHSSTPPTFTSINPVKILAALNNVLITRHNPTSSHPSIKPDPLTIDPLDNLSTLCRVTPNSNGTETGSKPIEAAYYILRATTPTSPSTTYLPNQGDDQIMRRKSHLQSALQAAQHPSKNTHLLAVVMNTMTAVFFHNIVGDQAERSAAAGRALALKSRDRLWVVVAASMYADTLEKAGKLGEAGERRREAEGAMGEVQGVLRELFGWS